MFCVGLSGYSYKPWKGEGRFYPEDLKAREFFDFYAKRYTTVEMDGTWYRMPSESMIEKWIEQAPAGFKYSPKMHRDVTHRMRLKPESLDSTKFFLKRLRPAAENGLLGPILVQLPPNLKIQFDRLSEYVQGLPRSTKELEGEGADAPLAYAFEFRNDTWFTDEVARFLEQNGIAIVATDTDEAEARIYDIAPHFYARLRKTEYTDDELAAWARRFSERAKTKDVYAYCKHEDDGSPWIWADELIRQVKI